MNDRQNPTAERPAGGDPDRPAGDRMSLYVNRMTSPEVVRARQNQRQAQQYATRGIVAFGRRPPKRAARPRKTIVASVAALTSIIAGGGAALAAQSSHQIQPGDTLSELALQYGSSVDELASLNSIADPDLIIAGDTLLVPTADAGNSAGASSTYTIVWGDTLYDIAQNHGTSVDTLSTLNGIADPDLIIVDDVLQLPASSDSATAPEVTVQDTSDGDGDGSVDAGDMSDDASDDESAADASSDTVDDSTSDQTDAGSDNSVDDATSDDSVDDTTNDDAADDATNDDATDDSADDDTTDESADDTGSSDSTDQSDDSSSDTVDAGGGDSTETAPAPLPVDSGIASLHLVTDGETLESIADQYGVTVDELLAVNAQAADGVSAGMILAIPDGGSSTVQLVGVPVVIADSADNTEAGAIAAATGYWGGEIPQEDTVAALADGGDPVDALTTVLEQYGYHAGVFSSDSGVDTLEAQIDAGIPVIVWLASEYGNHAVVVYGYDDSGAFILDPIDGSTARFAWDDFLATWDSAGGVALAVAPL